ncbi:hypothetical protein J6590_012683 [Homalodisca vitripennis]|nr:hypothetical protein J6590_012683 [Homalodisca vitripennis]
MLIVPWKTFGNAQVRAMKATVGPNGSIEGNGEDTYSNSFECFVFLAGTGTGAVPDRIPYVGITFTGRLEWFGPSAPSTEEGQVVSFRAVAEV